MDQYEFMRKEISTLLINLCNLQSRRDRTGGRELALAVTNLQQTVMWLDACIEERDEADKEG